MTLVAHARWPLLASLLGAAAMSCGSPSGSVAAYRPARAAETSPPKAAAPADVLPSLVATGEVAAFRAGSGAAGPWKDRAAAKSLPSSLSEGPSAPYSPGAGGRR